MEKDDIVKLTDHVIILKGVYLELIHLRHNEEKEYDRLPEELKYTLEGEIMLENIEGLNETIDDLDISIEHLRDVLNNNK